MQHLTERWASLHVANAAQQYVEMSARLMGGRNTDLKFTSIAALIGEYGKPMTSATLPTDVQRGDMGHCFANAGRIALMSRYTYVEGYAVAEGLFPMPHAWLTLDGKTAIDPTWENGVDYFGIPLKPAFVRKRINAAKMWGVIFSDVPDEEQIDWLRNGLPASALA